MYKANIKVISHSLRTTVPCIEVGTHTPTNNEKKMRAAHELQTQVTFNAAELSSSMYMHHRSSFMDVPVHLCTQCTEGDTVHIVSQRVKEHHRPVVKT